MPRSASYAFPVFTIPFNPILLRERKVLLEDDGAAKVHQLLLERLGVLLAETLLDDLRHRLDELLGLGEGGSEWVRRMRPIHGVG